MCTMLMLLIPLGADAQTSETTQAPAPASENWNLYFQSTAIGQMHPGFPARYSGTNSLPPYAEKRVSWTGTIFADFRINSRWDVVVNPEIAGGKGLGSVTGIAGFPNGEIPRVGTATPTLYYARAYVRYVAPLGSATTDVESGANQLAGSQPASRFTLIVGKFGITDFFDNNSYSHDPRTQFMNWSMMYNGAWDYPADLRGYSVGVMEELTMRRWSLRHATLLQPTVANGPTYDTRIAQNRGEVAEWETRFSPGRRAGAWRVLGYWNREHAGTFRDSLHVAEATGSIPNLDTSRRNGTKKYGFGLNLEQALTPGIGVFGRYGWNDGKTETWAFAQIDRSLSGGISLRGGLWKRPRDRAGIGAVRNQLSGDHRSFLAAGGLGFLIGDGALNYAPEKIVEMYYSAPVMLGFTFTGDYQRVWNPAYNQDRGPVSVFSIRVHWESTWRR